MPLDLGAITRLIGPRKRHLNLNVEAGKEIKLRPMEGDVELLLDETREKRDQLQHVTLYEDIRQKLETAAETARKSEYETVMTD